MEFDMSMSVTRITARIDVETQSLLSRAAASSGMPTLNAFILGAAVEKARRILREDELIRLDGQMTQQLLQALDNPPEPHDNLAELFRKHRTDE